MRLRPTPLRGLAEDTGGSVSMMMAMSFITLLGAAALAVDVGSLFLQSRKLQGIADLAAISAARDVGRATTAAQATAAENGWGRPLNVQVALGRYDPDPALAPSARFQTGGSNPSAARVTVSGEADLFFGRLLLNRETVTLTRRATAARADMASFSIGTRLASLQGGIANQLLSGLTGSTISLNVMDYNALAGAKVDLFKYSDLLRLNANLEAASYDKVLGTDISTGKALRILGDLLQGSGDIQAASAARKLAVAAGDGKKIKLDALLDLGPYGAQDHVAGGSGAKIELAAQDLANALVVLAGEGRQVKLDLGASVPGVTDVDVWLAIGERPNNSPWLTVDRDGQVVVRTAQTRLYLKAQALSVLGLLGAQPITLPVLVEAASGEAKLASMECPASLSAQAATLSVRPSVGRIVIGEIDTAKLNNFKQNLTVSRAKIADLLLVKATAKADVQIGGQSWKTARFTRADIQAGTIKTVATDDIAKATVSSLLGNLDLDVDILGIGLGLGPITSALSGTLGAIAAPLEGVLNALTGLLGVRLGEADVQLNGLRCRDAALVA
ncbi:putative membrane protein [Phenylobacterium haematophilum]|uniref:Putative membrane protein n=1 Tax=Phenylobacterium haematophilum TaxID=98513 RepID=A0A839ZW41_9CAUL|nr:pilus assembly protein TadG-related protein [Phenylobacterium haematophilum]MBB3889623.1 putative membrane protein [Phenylobacterium haematophilum]